jgi:hypothetical protein
VFAQSGRGSSRGRELARPVVLSHRSLQQRGGVSAGTKRTAARNLERWVQSLRVRPDGRSVGGPHRVQTSCLGRSGIVVLKHALAGRKAPALGVVAVMRGRGAQRQAARTSIGAARVAEIRPRNIRPRTEEMVRRERGVWGQESHHAAHDGTRAGGRRPRARRAASRSSASASRDRSARSSSRTPWPGGPASPIRARAAARRLSMRRTPSASSLIRTSSPAFKPSRRRSSTGRTRRPRSSRRAFPR